MASEDCFRRLLEINRLQHKREYLYDSLYPIIIHIYPVDSRDFKHPLVSFGMSQVEARQSQDFMYQWAHDKLVNWIRSKIGQV